jgi:hypothetical protein
VVLPRVAEPSAEMLNRGLRSKGVTVSLCSLIPIPRHSTPSEAMQFWRVQEGVSLEIEERKVVFSLCHTVCTIPRASSFSMVPSPLIASKKLGHDA